MAQASVGTHVGVRPTLHCSGSLTCRCCSRRCSCCELLNQLIGIKIEAFIKTIGTVSLEEETRTSLRWNHKCNPFILRRTSQIITTHVEKIRKLSELIYLATDLMVFYWSNCREHYGDLTETGDTAPRGESLTVRLMTLRHVAQCDLVSMTR